MIELTGYDSRFDEALEKLDRTIYLEITDHSDVFEDSICIALVDGEFAGAGLLIAEPTFLADPSAKLPIRHIRGEFKAVEGSPYEAEVSQALLDDLKESFRAICDGRDSLCNCESGGTDKPGCRGSDSVGSGDGDVSNDSDNLYLRLWCKASDTAYLDFLYDNGFTSLMTNSVMEFELSDYVASDADREKFGEHDSIDDASKSSAEPTLIGAEGMTSGIPEGIIFRELFLKDPIEIEEYFKTNCSAFGVPDSEEELRFRLRNFDGHVYALTMDSEVIASVTTWDMGDGRAATENIFCLEEFRRQGLTSAMLCRVLDMLKKDGYKKAVLTCFGNNLPAMSLYRKLGYETSNVMLGMHYR